MKECAVKGVYPGSDHICIFYAAGTQRCWLRKNFNNLYCTYEKKASGVRTCGNPCTCYNIKETTRRPHDKSEGCFRNKEEENAA